MFDNSVQVLISECNFFGYVQPKNKILKTCEEEYERFKEGSKPSKPYHQDIEKKMWFHLVTSLM